MVNPCTNCDDLRKGIHWAQLRIKHTHPVPLWTTPAWTLPPCITMIHIIKIHRGFLRHMHMGLQLLYYMYLQSCTSYIVIDCTLIKEQYIDVWWGVCDFYDDLWIQHKELDTCMGWSGQRKKFCKQVVICILYNIWPLAEIEVYWHIEWSLAP